MEEGGRVTEVGGNLVLFEEVSDPAGQRLDGSTLLGHHLLQVERDA